MSTHRVIVRVGPTYVDMRALRTKAEAEGYADAMRLQGYTATVIPVEPVQPNRITAKLVENARILGYTMRSVGPRERRKACTVFVHPATTIPKVFQSGRLFLTHAEAQTLQEIV
jgi:hypothetical protein